MRDYELIPQSEMLLKDFKDEYGKSKYYFYICDRIFETILRIQNTLRDELNECC